MPGRIHLSATDAHRLGHAVSPEQRKPPRKADARAGQKTTRRTTRVEIPQLEPDQPNPDGEHQRVWQVHIPDFHPARLNQLLGHHYRRGRLKRDDAMLVAHHLVQARVPRATGKRRVSLRLTLAPRQRAGDPDAYWKSLLDALVRCGALVDDNRHWCELGPVTFERGTRLETVIILEEV